MTKHSGVMCSCFRLSKSAALLRLDLSFTPCTAHKGFGRMLYSRMVSITALLLFAFSPSVRMIAVPDSCGKEQAA